MISEHTLKDLVVRSDYIVEATKESCNTEPDNESSLREVTNIINIKNVYKGNIEDKKIEVKTLQGTSGAVVFPEESRFLVFLAEHDGVVHVVNGLQGLWEIWEPDNSFMGMGHDISLEQLQEAIADTQGQEKPEYTIPEPAF